jgi:hypothetical protein
VAKEAAQWTIVYICRWTRRVASKVPRNFRQNWQVRAIVRSPVDIGELVEPLIHSRPNVHTSSAVHKNGRQCRRLYSRRTYVRRVLYVRRVRRPSQWRQTVSKCAKTDGGDTAWRGGEVARVNVCTSSPVSDCPIIVVICRRRRPIDCNFLPDTYLAVTTIPRDEHSSVSNQRTWKSLKETA